MSKKRKKRGSGKPQNRPQRETRKQRKNLYFWAGAIIVVAIAVLILSGRMPFGGKESKKGKSFTVQGGEKRPVLDPMMFSGRTRLAYAAAEKYPEVMDEVFCYCTCDEPPFYHKSLLSCFVEKHGAGWALCQKEALRAAQLHKEGKTIEEIKRAIDDAFGT